MDQLHLMTVFAAVADNQGFSSAARQLKMSAPAVTRAIAALEDRLEVKLLTRTTRYVRVTEAGARYLEDCRRILQEVEHANDAVQGIHGEPRGQISVTAPVLFGQQYVMPGIVEYLKTYPDTEIDAVFLDRIVNLLEEGFDVGIRIGELPDSSLHAKHVGTVKLQLVASTDYLNQHGIPQSPDDLHNHTLITSRGGSLAHDWYFLINNQKSPIHVTSRLNVSTNQGAINAALSGLGITRVISYQVAEELKSNKLKTVLSDYQLPPMPVHIVYREGPMAAKKIRVFIDLMADYLRKNKSLN